MKTRLTLTLLLVLLLAPAALLAIAAETPAEHGESAGEHGAGNTELIFKWLNFFLVFGGGGYFAAGPFRKWIAGERRAISDQIAEAQHQREESRRRLAEIEQKLAGLAQEIEALRREARENAAAEQVRLREAARRESERVLATARAEIDSAGRAARIELRAYAARLAVTLAEQRLRQQLTPQLHAALFQASVARLAPPTAALGGTRSA